jgi:hypothetical protein
MTTFLPDQSMEPFKFTIENLRRLMAESPAYQGLTAAEKDNIEQHIRQNNTPVLMYVYQQLKEESDSLEISRRKLAEKTLSVNFSDRRQIEQAVEQQINKINKNN